MAMFCGYPAVGQQRIESGDLRGFTSSPTEHIIVELDKPIPLKIVRGQILDAGGHPIPALVEIRGPDQEQKVRGTKADKNGKFKIHGVKEGTYRFKVTLNGFQSVVGTLVVSKKAPLKNTLKISMPFGV